jgi:squalene-hopene/tetraprenyl-beta-curcumene cyclase
MAFANMWAAQLPTGPSAGAWDWLDFSLKPWESTDAQYFGAALAALAVGVAPEQYGCTDAIQPPFKRLNAYLTREYPNQSLLNRMMLLWAASKVPALATLERRDRLIAEIESDQRRDGSWRLPDLTRPQFLSSPRAYLRSWVDKSGLIDQASDGYATGLATVVLLQAGEPPTSPVVQSAIRWLSQHEDPGGFWPATSLNTRRDPTSNVGRFMTDAATAFASLALVDATEPRVADVATARRLCPGSENQ